LNIVNNGPSAAKAVTLTDSLPAGATFVSASSSQGSCSGNATVICQLGTLTPGSSGIVTIVARLMSAGVITNSANVTSDAIETNPSNNTASATTAAFGSCTGTSGYKIAGKVRRSNGTAISGVNMTVIRTSTTPQCGNRTMTASDGTYQFTKLANGTYSVTPYKSGCTSFTPTSKTVTISGGNKTGQNFTGVCP
jgi:hypothetical protein